MVNPFGFFFPVPFTVTTPSRQDKITEENIPSWVKAASKLLNSGCEGADWLALATKLGRYINGCSPQYKHWDTIECCNNESTHTKKSIK